MSAAEAIEAPSIEEGLREYRWLALQLARAYTRRVPPSVSLQDLEQAAIIGLWDALRRCPPDVTPTQRANYLKVRIRGQILDELRCHDWLPRRTRSRQNPQCPLLHVVVLHGEDTVPAFRGEPRESWESTVADLTPNIEERLTVQTLAAQALEAPLLERERVILRESFWRGRKQADIAASLCTSDARVSQLLTRAAARMRRHLEQEEERLEHLNSDRRARSAASEDPPSRIVARPVPGSRLGGSTAAAADRRVPAGAAGPELGGAAREELRAAGAEAGHADPAAAGDGGLAVMDVSVPSVLPEEGFSLYRELGRYRDWMLDQALARASGSHTVAAALLGLNRTTLIEMLKRRGQPHVGLKAQAEQAITETLAELGNKTAAAKALGIGRTTLYRKLKSEPAPGADSVQSVAGLIDWPLVARLRAEGRNEWSIVCAMRRKTGGSRWLVEKALKLGPPKEQA